MLRDCTCCSCRLYVTGSGGTSIEEYSGGMRSGLALLVAIRREPVPSLPDRLTLTVWPALGQSKGPGGKAPEPKPMDYIVEHLTRAKGKSASREHITFPKDSIASVLLMTDVAAVGDCSLSLHFKTSLTNFSDLHPAVFTKEEAVSINLKDVELNSPKADGGLVTARMRAALKITSQTNLVSTDTEPINFSSTEDRYEITVPAFDEEDARRLARAVNEQIRICGGKADPFAK